MVNRARRDGEGLYSGIIAAPLDRLDQVASYRSIWIPPPLPVLNHAHVSISTSITSQTSVIVISVSSAESSLGTMASKATTSLFSENAIVSSASGHSPSLSASAASATSSGGASSTGNPGVGVFVGGLMLAGGIVAGL